VNAVVDHLEHLSLGHQWYLDEAVSDGFWFPHHHPS